MKLGIGKRLVLFIHWLLSVVAAVGFLTGRIHAGAGAWIESWLDRIPQKNVVFIAAAVIYVIFAVFAIGIIFSRSSKRRDRGFIVMDSSETGRVRIAVSAIDQMTRQALATCAGIADMKTAITSQDDSVSISVNVTVAEGSHIPTVTVNVQQAIRQFVEMNCGIAVRSVAVNVQSVATGKAGKAHKTAEPIRPQTWEPVITPKQEEPENSEQVAAPAYEAPRLTLDMPEETPVYSAPADGYTYGEMTEDSEQPAESEAEENNM